MHPGLLLIPLILGWIALPAQHVIVDRQRFRPVAFDSKYRESQLFDKKFQHAMFELKELARAMRGFAQGNNLCIPDHPLQGTQIVQSTVRIGAL